MVENLLFQINISNFNKIYIQIVYVFYNLVLSKNYQVFINYLLLYKELKKEYLIAIC